MKTQTTHKQRVVKAAVATLLVLAVCTVAARTIYNLLLPQVESQPLRSGNLVYTSWFTATVTGDSAAAQVVAADSWNIRSVAVQEGQTVEKGDVLMAMDVQEYRIRLTQLEASIQQKQNMLNATDWSAGDRAVQEKELLALQQQYAQLRGKFPADGRVTAPESGVVSGLCTPGMAPQGTVLGVIRGEGSGTFLEWSMPPAQAKQILKAGARLACRYDVLQHTEGVVLEEKQAEATLVSSRYKEAQGVYVIRAALNSEEPVKVGTGVAVTAIAKSEDYPALVPLACVMQDAEGSYVMILEESKGIWGIVTKVVRVPVTVLESDHQYAALSNAMDSKVRLAAYPTRPLQEGEAVRVAGT